jgi:signal transduction histidine kinase
MKQLEHHRILIVDDEATQMRALCDTLRAQGYETFGFISAEAALGALRTAAFDLLLADLMMPEMDGISLVQAARSLDSDLACIVMTGEGSIATAVSAMKVGALDYILKPFKLSVILPVLARALETRQLRMENALLERRLREHAVELDAAIKNLNIAKKLADSANQEKSRFLSNMSHELRTPLNSIIGFAKILSSDTLPSTPEQRQRFTDSILASGRHLLTLINEILDLAQVESGTLALSLEPVALAEVFYECGTMIEPLANQRGIQTRFPDRTGTQVLADRTRLKQVLINLLSNAIKYNRENGTVTVSCASAGAGRIRISVQDTGAGLHATQLEAIFQPFNRLGREAGGEEGTGIGLGLTRHLMRLMRGEITVASTVGSGSTFHIELASCDFVSCVAPTNAVRVP